MYNEFFNFREKPFKLTPKTSIFYEKSPNSSTYNSLLEGLQQGENLSLLCGQTGTGKTLCAQKLHFDLNRDPQYHAVNLPFTSLPFDEMLGYFLTDLNLSYGLGHDKSKLEILQDFLQRGTNNLVQSVVMIIDEAQNLNQSGFDGLSELLTLNENSQRKLQLVLVARHESDLNLNQQNMAAFNRSISQRYQLTPFNKEETIAYIQFQLDTVGSSYGEIFTECAYEEIFAVTQGVARPINILCDQALEIAASEQLHRISAEQIKIAHRQQKFEDTIEMNTSLISESLKQFERKLKPAQLIQSHDQEFPDLDTPQPEVAELNLVKPEGDPVTQTIPLEVIDNPRADAVLAKAHAHDLATTPTQTEKPAEENLSIVEIAEIASPANDAPHPSETDHYTEQNPFKNPQHEATLLFEREEQKEPNRHLRHFFIGSGLLISSFALTYYQINQEQILAYFEQQQQGKKSTGIKDLWTEYISPPKSTQTVAQNSNDTTVIQSNEVPPLVQPNSAQLTPVQPAPEQFTQVQVKSTKSTNASTDNVSIASVANTSATIEKNTIAKPSTSFDDQTAYHTRHEDDYKQRQNQHAPITKPPLEEENNLVWIQSLINVFKGSDNPAETPTDLISDQTPVADTSLLTTEIETKRESVSTPQAITSTATTPSALDMLPLAKTHPIEASESNLELSDQQSLAQEGANALAETTDTNKVETALASVEPAFSAQPTLSSAKPATQKEPTAPAPAIVQEEHISITPHLETNPTGISTPLSDIDRLFATAHDQINRNRLTQPQNDSALSTYRKILKLDPTNSQAHAGIARLKSNFVGWARNNVRRDRVERAKRHYSKALIIDPNDQQIQTELAELELYYPSYLDVEHNPGTIQQELF